MSFTANLHIYKNNAYCTTAGMLECKTVEIEGNEFRPSLFVGNIFLYSHDYPSLSSNFKHQGKIPILQVSKLEQGGAWRHWSSSIWIFVVKRKLPFSFQSNPFLNFFLLANIFIFTRLFKKKTPEPILKSSPVQIIQSTDEKTLWRVSVIIPVCDAS